MEHHQGFELTPRALAYLKLNLHSGSSRCGACGYPKVSCAKSPCPTRLEAMED